MKGLREHKLNPARLLVMVGLLGVVAIIALACSNGDTDTVAQPSGTEAVEEVHEEGPGHEEAKVAHEHDAHDDEAAALNEHEDVTEEDDVLEIMLEAKGWRFGPDVLEVLAGKRVKLTLVNAGHVEHDVEVIDLPAEDVEAVGGSNHDRLDGGRHHEGVVAAHAESGTSATVMFTPTKPGEYEFICTIHGHREAGMVGKLVVTE